MKNKTNQSKILIITSPMCQEILHLAGISDYKVAKNKDYSGADIAIILSETEVDKNSSTQFIKLKLNTFPQIKQSIQIVAEILNTETRSRELNEQLNNYFTNSTNTKNRKNENRKIKVKVYSNFLTEIVRRHGFRYGYRE